MPRVPMSGWGHVGSALGFLQGQMAEQGMCVTPTSSFKLVGEKLFLYLENNSYKFKITPLLM